MLFCYIESSHIFITIQYKISHKRVHFNVCVCVCVCVIGASGGYRVLGGYRGLGDPGTLMGR